MQNILSQIIFNNPISLYIWSIVIFIAIFAVLRIIKTVVVEQLHKLAKKTKTDSDDFIIEIIKKISKFFYYSVALFFAARILSLPEFLSKALYYVLIIAAVYETVKFVQALIDYAVKRVISKEHIQEKSNVQAIKLFSNIAKTLVWTGAAIIILSNFGFNVSSLVAGLGIGGIAIALAIQNILGDLFNSLSIYIDKPFEVGDFIIVGEEMGVVKKIGLKTTRITALRGEEIVISNQDLTNSRVLNFKKMDKRRIAFEIGVIYSTDKNKLEKIPKIIENIINRVELSDFDRCHFKSFGDFSLNFEIVYYVKTNDYNKYMDIQQEINLAIFDEFNKEGIEFAFPTQTIEIKK